MPGEELPKVTYRVIDPEQFHNQRVLIVGGGDSAVEAACSISEVSGTEVTISYRSEAFSRAKAENREKIQIAAADGRLRVLLRSTVTRITEEHVELTQHEETLRIPNDSVIINAGGILPSAFLRGIGIEVITKFGTE